MAGVALPSAPPVTQITDFGGAANTVFYADSSGEVAEVALGADGEVLTSQGPAAAPAFEPVGTSVGLILALG